MVRVRVIEKKLLILGNLHQLDELILEFAAARAGPAGGEFGHVTFEHEEIGGFEEADDSEILLDDRKAFRTVALDSSDDLIDAGPRFLERDDDLLSLVHKSSIRLYINTYTLGIGIE